MHSTKVGMLCYAICSVFMGLMAVTVKLAGIEGVPAAQIVFSRSVVLMACALPPLIMRRENPLGNRRKLLCLRGFLGFGAVSTLFLGIQLMPLQDMTVFTFLAPVFLALASPAMLGESIVPGTRTTCAACMVAVLFVAQPSFLFGHARLSLAAVGVGLLHPAVSAGAKACVRLCSPTESTHVIMFYLAAFSVTGSVLGMLLIPHQLKPVESVYELALLVLAGLFSFLYQSFMNMGLRRVKAAQAMSMSYLGIVWSGVAGILVFHEFPNAWSLLGIVVIVIATLTFGLRSSGALRWPKARGES